MHESVLQNYHYCYNDKLHSRYEWTNRLNCRCYYNDVNQKHHSLINSTSFLDVNDTQNFHLLSGTCHTPFRRKRNSRVVPANGINTAVIQCTVRSHRCMKISAKKAGRFRTPRPRPDQEPHFPMQGNARQNMQIQFYRYISPTGKCANKI